jgi:Holliday junction resolvasome RuvABC ATP-dependent DNA helicase subunit
VFDPYPGYTEMLFPPMAHDEIERRLDPADPESPFHGYIGNTAAIQQIGDFLYHGFRSPAIADDRPTGDYSNHCLGPQSLAFIGPPSAGKTELARRLGRAIQLPMVECDRNIKNPDDLFAAMQAEASRYYIPFRPRNERERILQYLAPPMIVFFDEAHGIRGDWLLKPTEPNDAVLITQKATVDVRQILWIFATTHRGKLSKAFDSRAIKIMLESHSRKDVGQIVRMKYPTFSPQVCFKIAGYARCIPREALAFANQVQMAAERNRSKDIAKMAELVAVRIGVDEEGFTRQHMAVLTALYKEGKPVAEKRLADHVRVAEEDLQEYIMPPLTLHGPDSLPLVRVSSRGYEITEEGTAALLARKQAGRA